MSYIFSREKNINQKILALLFSQGVQALLIYRLSRLCFTTRVLNMFRLHLFFYRINQFICSVDIEPEAILGKNICLPHPIGIVIGGTAKISDDVIIMQGVTIGSRKLGLTGKRHANIGEGVFIGPNACILGPISIGKDAVIGANAVVLDDVPAYGKFVK